MKPVKYGLLAMTALIAGLQAKAATISLDLGGRSGADGNPPWAALLPADVAGVVPVANWNQYDAKSEPD